MFPKIQAIRANTDTWNYIKLKTSAQQRKQQGNGRIYFQTIPLIRG
jgi:hypothetical protein